MKKSILFFLILLSIFLIGCDSKGVDRLDKIILPYSELPKEVKQQIFTNNFIDLNEPTRYKEVLKTHSFLRWIKETEIHRTSDSKIFKMKSLKGEWGHHLVILDNYLYVPNHYNIYLQDSLTYNFSRFRLE